MAAMVQKWLPVIDMGVIGLSSEFQPVALQMAEIWTLKKSKMAANVPRWPPWFQNGYH